MKITDVSLTLFSWDSLPEVRYGGHNPGTGDRASMLGLLTISTDDGVEGQSFLGSAARSAELDGQALISVIKPLLIGENPLNREALYRRIYKKASRATTLRCIGAVDVALWDLGGKAAGLPLYQMIGGSRDSIPAYASSALLPNAEAYVEESLAMRERGFQAYKIHPPCNWREDIRICEAVREACGPEYPLMLDSIWSYDYTQALRVGLAIQDLDYYWYEDPLLENNISGYVQLKQQLHIPLMATEHAAGGLQGYVSWLGRGATDYLRGDVAVKGGLTPCLKAAHLAEAFGINYEVHHGGNSLNNVANLHLSCAIPNTEFFEVLLPDGAQKYGLVEDIEIDREGYVRPSDRAGLGAEIDYEAIRKRTVAVL